MRDWGHAKDYVKAMWLMLQQDDPDDYVIATGEQHSVREFVEKSADYFGMKLSGWVKVLTRSGLIGIPRDQSSRSVKSISVLQK